jgi:RNA polymerase sigma factor (TIGR02999 family)
LADEPVTLLLAASRDGDPAAMARAFAAVYGELHALAHRQRARSRPGDTLSTTVLVHEAFLKLAHGAPVAVQDRHHFFALAARAMRQILVDAARARAADKRGSGIAPVELLEGDLRIDAVAVDIVALDRALDRLEAVDPRLTRLVEGRFFAGLTDPELAATLGRNERTVRRDWQRARAFLLRELRGTEEITD